MAGLHTIAINNLDIRGGKLYRPEGKLQMQVYATYETPGSGCEIKVEVRTSSKTYYFPESGSIDKGNEKDGIQITSDGTVSDVGSRTYYSIPTFTLNLNSRIGMEEVRSIKVYIKRSGIAATWYDKTISITNSFSTKPLIKTINKDKTTEAYEIKDWFYNKVTYDSVTSAISGIGGASRYEGLVFETIDYQKYGEQFACILDKRYLKKYGVSCPPSTNPDGRFYAMLSGETEWTPCEISLLNNYRLDDNHVYYCADIKDLKGNLITGDIYKLKIELVEIINNTPEVVYEAITTFVKPLKHCPEHQVFQDIKDFETYFRFSDEVATIRPFNYYINDLGVPCRKCLLENDGHSVGIVKNYLLNQFFNSYSQTRIFLVLNWSNNNEGQHLKIPFQPFSSLDMVYYESSQKILEEYLEENIENILKTISANDINSIQYSILVEGESCYYLPGTDTSTGTSRIQSFTFTNIGLNISMQLYEPLYVLPGAIEAKIQKTTCKYTQYPLIVNKGESITLGFLDTSKIYNPHSHLVLNNAYKIWVIEDGKLPQFTYTIPYNAAKETYKERKLTMGVYYEVGNTKIYNLDYGIDKTASGIPFSYRQGRIASMDVEYVKIKDGKIIYQLNDNGGDSFEGNYNIFLDPNGQSSLSRVVTTVVDGQLKEKRLQKFKFQFTITGLDKPLSFVLSTDSGLDLSILLSYLYVGYRIELPLSSVAALVDEQSELPEKWWEKITKIEGIYYWGLDGNDSQTFSFSCDNIEIISESPSFALRKHGIIVNPLTANETLEDDINEKVNVVLNETGAARAININIYDSDNNPQDFCNIEYKKDDGFYFDGVNVKKLKEKADKNATDITTIISAFQGYTVAVYSANNNQRHNTHDSNSGAQANRNYSGTVEFNLDNAIPSNAKCVAVVHPLLVETSTREYFKTDVQDKSYSVTGCDLTNSKKPIVSYTGTLVNRTLASNGVIFNMRAYLFVAIPPTIST